MRKSIGSHVWKKIPAREVQEIESKCLRELGFRSHCSLNYFYSQGYAPVRCNNLVILNLCNCFNEKMHSQFPSAVFLFAVGNRGVLNLTALGPINVSHFASLSVSETYSTQWMVAI